MMISLDIVFPILITASGLYMILLTKNKRFHMKVSNKLGEEIAAKRIKTLKIFGYVSILSGISGLLLVF